MLNSASSRLLCIGKGVSLRPNVLSLAPRIARPTGVLSPAFAAPYSTKQKTASSPAAKPLVVKAPARAAKPKPKKSAPASSKAPRKFPEGHVISTLNPAKLTKADYCDLSGKTNAAFQLSEPDKNGSPMQIYYALPYVAGPFPAGTSGFLYLHKPPAWAPQIAYELRFRVTKSSNPTSFSAGHDLQYEGLPWSVPLLYHTAIKAPAVRTLLNSDRLMTEPQILEVERLSNKLVPREAQSAWPLLYAMNQPFRLNFDLPYNALVTVTRSSNPGENQSKHLLSKLSVDLPAVQQGRNKWVNLYRGSAIARWEWSEDPKDKGTRTAVIRILKIVRPIVHNSVSGVKESILPPIKSGSLLPWFDRKMTSPTVGGVYSTRDAVFTRLPANKMAIDEV